MVFGSLCVYVFAIKSNNREDKVTLQYRENLDRRKWFVKLRNVITRDFNDERAASNEFFIRCGMDRPQRTKGWILVEFIIQLVSCGWSLFLPSDLMCRKTRLILSLCEHESIYYFSLTFIYLHCISLIHRIPFSFKIFHRVRFVSRAIMRKNYVF